MAEPCTVLVAAEHLMPALKERALENGGELITFSDSEALRALDVIGRRRPHVVALERTFAATPRGVALINRIKADPTLRGSAIHVVPDDRDVRAGARAVAANSMAAPEPTRTTPAAPLDKRGTRRAPRYAIRGDVEVVVDGKPATLVDLSTVGAQIVSGTILKPNQKVRMTIADDLMAMRLTAIVAWASFEIPPKIGPRYRCGIEFLDGNAGDLDAYRMRLTGQAEPI